MTQTLGITKLEIDIFVPMLNLLGQDKWEYLALIWKIPNDFVAEEIDFIVTVLI